MGPWAVGGLVAAFSVAERLEETGASWAQRAVPTAQDGGAAFLGAPCCLPLGLLFSQLHVLREQAGGTAVFVAVHGPGTSCCLFFLLAG